MEKHFLDEIYTEALESVITEKKLNENEIEEFLTEQLTEEKLQNYYKEVIDKLNELNIRQNSLIEVSGGITDETILDYANLGVDIISIGAITHSVKAFDISMKIKND